MVAVNHKAPNAAVSRASVKNHPTLRSAKKNKNTVQILSQNTRGIKSEDRIEDIATSTNKTGVRLQWTVWSGVALLLVTYNYILFLWALERITNKKTLFTLVKGPKLTLTHKSFISYFSNFICLAILKELRHLIFSIAIIVYGRCIED